MNKMPIDDTRQLEIEMEMRASSRFTKEAFKRCILSMENKVLTQSEKKCINEYFEFNKSFNEEMVKGMSRICAERAADEMSSLVFK
ncbi:hypothetical protein SteCoe_21864 [Stentor coeruleus]|uniref:Tim10-like domain-containing protein n=1 Tax=Stentor coeruleus TaxID=5963 RepID=A0A1R2BNL5_9CILI|nr:hypothetical protein SteCoe_21864 [Stentor coeruleus]